MTADEEKLYEGDKTDGGLEGQGRSGAQPREVTPGYVTSRQGYRGWRGTFHEEAVREQDRVRCGQSWVSRG